ncbi:hypothetical protein NBRC111894_1224 [Sporolactobacillus inulinus]|uniref:NERD domain-containing protein n=2 Tax=Sporolactobacillus TaxID=2077 RepID=A0A4Y1Z9G3_9BACL|nr:nuclease-related domain-containing protein [Sporolactobacillus inulinus]GAY75670.1 hypothetical protein NBRC111894_1224 [Sporolactobacillus inulinus]
MYVKPIQVPFHVLQYEALVRRLNPCAAHEDIRSLYKRAIAGYRGERSMSYPLCYLPEEDFRIFHNLRLYDGIHYFQIDFLALCERFALILEVKNIIGKLTFDTEMLQLIRELDDTLDIYDDPISQANHLTDSLRQWLSKRGVFLPIRNRVVIASAAQIQVTDLNNDQIKKIVRRANLKSVLLKINKQFTEAHLSAGELDKITANLLAAHQKKMIQPFKTFKIQSEQIKKGVQCPNCGATPVEKVKQRWICRACDHHARFAYLTALRDYFLIYGPAITNSQCRDFLNLGSESTTRRLLHRTALHFDGNKKSRIYYLSEEILDEKANWSINLSK